MTDTEKLLALQEHWARELEKKIDVYRVKGKGILVVLHRQSLNPSNVLFRMSDAEFNQISL